MRKLVEKYRQELAELRHGPGQRKQNQATPPAQPKPNNRRNRRNQRSRRQGQQSAPEPEPEAEGEPDSGEQGDEERSLGWEPGNGEPDGEGEAEE